MGDITGGPGGTSTTLTSAPCFFAMASTAGRIACAISWLLRSGSCLSSPITRRAPTDRDFRLVVDRRHFQDDQLPPRQRARTQDREADPQPQHAARAAALGA